MHPDKSLDGSDGVAKVVVVEERLLLLDPGDRPQVGLLEDEQLVALDMLLLACVHSGVGLHPYGNEIALLCQRSAGSTYNFCRHGAVDGWHKEATRWRLRPHAQVGGGRAEMLNVDLERED